MITHACAQWTDCIVFSSFIYVFLQRAHRSKAARASLCAWAQATPRPGQGSRATPTVTTRLHRSPAAAWSPRLPTPAPVCALTNIQQIWIARLGYASLSGRTILRQNISIFHVHISSFLGGCPLNPMYGSSTVANVLAEHSSLLLLERTEQIEPDNPKEIYYTSFRFKLHRVRSDRNPTASDSITSKN